MYNKYIIFYTANYCQKIKAFFDVDELIHQGVHVEFWDLSELTIHEHLSSVQSKGLIEKKFYNHIEFDNAVKVCANEDCLFMSFVNYAYYSWRIYRILSKYNVDILYATTGSLPMVNPATTKRIRRFNFSKVVKKLRPKQISNILHYVALRIILKTSIFKPAKFVLISCESSRNECDYKTSSNTQYVNCSSGDFNNYLTSTSTFKNSTSKVSFIDQYLPFHDEFDILGWGHIDHQKYFEALNRFFDIIEDTYNCKIVICAHPSAALYKEEDYFNGREIVYNDTINQVKESIGVITHFSTAISFAVMAAKPLILSTTDELNSKYPELKQLIDNFGYILNIPVMNMDHCMNVRFRDVDEVAYNNYKYQYLTTQEAENKTHAEILLNLSK